MKYGGGRWSDIMAAPEHTPGCRCSWPYRCAMDPGKTPIHPELGTVTEPQTITEDHIIAHRMDVPDGPGAEIHSGRPSECTRCQEVLG